MKNGEFTEGMHNIIFVGNTAWFAATLLLHACMHACNSVIMHDIVDIIDF